MNKIIIINWKWKTWEKGIMTKEIQVQGDSSLKVICKKYYSDHIKQFQEELDFLINENKECSFLILLHYDNQIAINNIKSDNKNIKMFQFGDGEGDLYYTTTNPLGLLDILVIHNNAKDNDKIKKENFLHVWSWYWDNVYWKYQKSKIINTWLPLAIDIQGLSEIEGKFREEYIKSIKLDLDQYSEKLIKDWHEITNSISEYYQINIDKCPIDIEYNDKINIEKAKNNLFNYLNKSFDKNSNEFLPNWLENVIKVIDLIISSNT